MGKRLRYHELVDASFLRELTEEEQRELRELGDMIDAENAVEYQAIIDRLEKKLEEVN